MTDFIQIISSNMRELSKSDCDGALPYLMLTSKSESVVRDLLAFRLHQELQTTKHQTDRRYVVAREYTILGRKGSRGKRVDIAILKFLEKKGEKTEPVCAALEITMVGDASKADHLGTKKRPSGLRKVQKDLMNLKRLLDKQRAKVDKKQPRRLLKCYGLLVVREAKELNNGKANTKVIAYRVLKPKHIKDLPAVYGRVKSESKRLNLKLLRSSERSCGKDDWLGASVDLRWWLFSLR